MEGDLIDGVMMSLCGWFHRKRCLENDGRNGLDLEAIETSNCHYGNWKGEIAFLLKDRLNH